MGTSVISGTRSWLVFGSSSHEDGQDGECAQGGGVSYWSMDVGGTQEARSLVWRLRAFPRNGDSRAGHSLKEGSASLEHLTARCHGQSLGKDRF